MHQWNSSDSADVVELNFEASVNWAKVHWSWDGKWVQELAVGAGTKVYMLSEEDLHDASPQHARGFDLSDGGWTTERPDMMQRLDCGGWYATLIAVDRGDMSRSIEVFYDPPSEEFPVAHVHLDPQLKTAVDVIELHYNPWTWQQSLLVHDGTVGAIWSDIWPCDLPGGHGTGAEPFGSLVI